MHRAAEQAALEKGDRSIRNEKTFGVKGTYLREMGFINSDSVIALQELKRQK